MEIWGRARDDGTPRSCCPNMVLHFVSSPELFRLHCGREEAEEWAASQIVSVLAALWDGHGGSGCLPTSVPCSPMGGSPWVESSALPWPMYLFSIRLQIRVGGGFFFPWDVGKWIQPLAKVWGT